MLLVLIVGASIWFPLSFVEGGDALSRTPEFSGRLVKRADGKQYQTQVFGKGDRLKPEMYFDEPPGYKKRVGSIGRGYGE